MDQSFLLYLAIMFGGGAFFVGVAWWLNRSM